MLDSVEWKLVPSLTSRLNRTPPMGDPNATEMPEAAAADKTSRFRAGQSQIFRYRLWRSPARTFIVIDIAEQFHQKICTTACYMHQRTLLAEPHPWGNCETLKTLAINRNNFAGLLTSPSDFITNVHVPINLRITKPPNTVLISGIPLCFAYNAYSLTSTLAVIANKTLNSNQWGFFIICQHTYWEENKEKVFYKPDAARRCDMECLTPRYPVSTLWEPVESITAEVLV